MKIGIGIDTGGTYTDTCLYDYNENRVLCSNKSLTTRDNLAIGIESALSGLDLELMKKASLVSLSTTLATNACVENKGGRGRIVMFGFDLRVVSSAGESYGLPPMSDMIFVDCETTLDGLVLREPDWEAFEELAKTAFDDCDSIAVTELYAVKNGAVIEKKAKRILKKHTKKPVVCAHELFGELNSLGRAASTLLNARLMEVIEGFLDAIDSVMGRLGITAPVVIVRSDATLMSREFTSMRPVETLLCGPAASVMGGVALSREPDSLIVDMGGTTTDIAIVKNSEPLRDVNGVRVGQWKTFVKGISIDTFALGGDTAIGYREGKLILGHERIVPLSILGTHYPEAIKKLDALVSTGLNHTHHKHEFYLLLRPLANEADYTKGEAALCRALKEGPLIKTDAAAAAGQDIYTINTRRLEREGHIIRSGLTPTDIMHLKGDFSSFDRNAALLGAQYVSGNLFVDTDELCHMAYNAVEHRLYSNLVRILLCDRYPHYRRKGLDEGVMYLIDESFNTFKQGGEPDSFIRSVFSSCAALVGIGAPTHVFLPEVARALGTKCVIPPHAPVANAVGAVLGRIAASSSVEIRPFNIENSDEIGLTVYTGDAPVRCESVERAIEIAEDSARTQACQKARAHGASGDLIVTSEVEKTLHGTILLNIKVTASASSAGLGLGF